MTTSEGSSSGGAAIQYGYGTEDKSSSSGSNKPPMFNGDPETSSWWKTKMYNHNMGLDEEL